MSGIISSASKGRPASITLREEFSPKAFLSQAPKANASGTEVPAWKRLIIARQLAERAQKEADEQQRVTLFTFPQPPCFLCLGDILFEDGFVLC